MDPFSYRDGELFAEELPVAQLAERWVHRLQTRRGTRG